MSKEEQVLEKKLSQANEFMEFFNTNPYLKHVSKSFKKTLKPEGKIHENHEALEQTLKNASDYFDLDNILKKKEPKKEQQPKKDPYEDMDAHFTKEYINLGEAALAEELYKRMIAQERPDISEREKDLRKQLTNFQAKTMIMDNDFKDLRQKNLELLSHNKMLSKRVENLLEEVDELTKAKMEYDRKLKNIERHYKNNDETYKLLKGFIEINMDDIEEQALQKAKKLVKFNNSKINLNQLAEPEKTAKEISPRRRSSIAAGSKAALFVGTLVSKEKAESKDNTNVPKVTVTQGSPKGSPVAGKFSENIVSPRNSVADPKKAKDLEAEKGTNNEKKKKQAVAKKN